MHVILLGRFRADEESQAPSRSRQTPTARHRPPRHRTDERCSGQEGTWWRFLKSDSRYRCHGRALGAQSGSDRHGRKRRLGPRLATRRVSYRVSRIAGGIARTWRGAGGRDVYGEGPRAHVQDAHKPSGRVSLKLLGAGYSATRRSRWKRPSGSHTPTSSPAMPPSSACFRAIGRSHGENTDLVRAHPSGIGMKPPDRDVRARGSAAAQSPRANWANVSGLTSRDGGPRLWKAENSARLPG